MVSNKWSQYGLKLLALKTWQDGFLSLPESVRIQRGKYICGKSSPIEPLQHVSCTIGLSGISQAVILPMILNILTSHQDKPRAATGTVVGATGRARNKFGEVSAFKSAPGFA
jgi:hypothetical protein